MLICHNMISGIDSQNAKYIVKYYIYIFRTFKIITKDL